MPDGEPWGLKPSFHLQNCLRIRSDKFPKLLLQQLLWLPESWPGAHDPEGDRFALPPFPAALGVPAGMCHEGDTQCVRQGRDPALPQLFAHPSQVLLAGGLELLQQSCDD